MQRVARVCQRQLSYRYLFINVATGLQNLGKITSWARDANSQTVTSLQRPGLGNGRLTWRQPPKTKTLYFLSRRDVGASRDRLWQLWPCIRNKDTHTRLWFYTKNARSTPATMSNSKRHCRSNWQLSLLPVASTLLLVWTGFKIKCSRAAIQAYKSQFNSGSLFSGKEDAAQGLRCCNVSADIVPIAPYSVPIV